MQAIILASLLAGFAPAPVYREKPLTRGEREKLLKEAEAEMERAAADARGLLRWSKAEFAAHMIRYKRWSRSAGEKLGRAHAGLPAGPMRFRVAEKAAEAWLKAGDNARALGYYEDAAKQSPDAKGRLMALWGVRACYARLGKRGEAEKARRRLLEEGKEAEALGEAAAVEWLRAILAEDHMTEW